MNKTRRALLLIRVVLDAVELQKVAQQRLVLDRLGHMELQQIPRARAEIHRRFRVQLTDLTGCASLVRTRQCRYPYSNPG